MPNGSENDMYYWLLRGVNSVFDQSYYTEKGYTKIVLRMKASWVEGKSVPKFSLYAENQKDSDGKSIGYDSMNLTNEWAEYEFDLAYFLQHYREFKNNLMILVNSTDKTRTVWLSAIYCK